MGFPITRTIVLTFLITGIYIPGRPFELNYLSSDCFRSSVIFHFLGPGSNEIKNHVDRLCAKSVLDLITF